MTMSETETTEFLKGVKSDLLSSVLQGMNESSGKREDDIKKLSKLLSENKRFQEYVSLYSKIGKKQVNKTKFLTSISKLSDNIAENKIENAKNWKNRLMICYISGLESDKVEKAFWMCKIAERKKKFVYSLEPKNIQPKNEDKIDLIPLINEYNKANALKMYIEILPNKNSGLLDTIIRIHKENAQKTISYFEDRDKGNYNIKSDKKHLLSSKKFNLRFYDDIWHIQTSYDLELNSETNEYTIILGGVLDSIFNKKVILHEETSIKVKKFENTIKTVKNIKNLENYLKRIRIKAKELINKSDYTPKEKENLKKIADTFGVAMMECRDENIKLKMNKIEGDISELDTKNDSSLRKVKEILKRGGKVSITFKLDEKKIEFKGGRKLGGNLNKEEEEAMEFLLKVL